MITILCFFCLSLYAVRALGAGEVVTVLGIENYHPYSYMEDGQAKGFYNDLLRHLFERAGYQVGIRLMPYKRALAYVEHGDAHGVAGVFLTVERAKYAEFLLDLPLATVTRRTFTLVGSGINSGTIEAFRGRKIGHKRGFLVSEAFRRAADDKVFQEVTSASVEQLVKMLLDERIDAFCHTTNNTLHYAEKLDKEGRIRSFGIPGQPKDAGRKTYLAFSRSLLKTLPAGLIPDLKKAYQSMRADGSFKRLAAHYKITPTD